MSDHIQRYTMGFTKNDIKLITTMLQYYINNSQTDIQGVHICDTCGHMESQPNYELKILTKFLKKFEKINQ